ncbi:MAG: preprotein translocase subunit SecY, partial [Candidatus Lokiarchaeota archaeon]|nr:preprotein translocase subunit SecY [Candidatus Lokiarchaeota archaeon]
GALTPDKITYIFMQLLASGIIIILLDEVIQKGWGIGSGVSLFIAAGVAGQILWSAFSFLPATYTNPADTTQTLTEQLSNGTPLMRGAILAFFQTFSTGEVGLSFFRHEGLPTMFGVIVTAIIFFIVVYTETIKVEIPLQYTGYRGFAGKYPIKLMYVSNIPVILAQALYANVLFFGQLIAGPTSALRTQAQGNPVFTFLLDLIGTPNPQTGTQNTFVGGLIYYLTPPRGLNAIGADPLRAVIYFIIFLFLCIYFGQIWVDVSGLAPRDISQQILDSGMSIPGFRNSAKPIERILKRYIPTLTILCGIIVAVLAFTADAFDALGSGTGILLTVGIMHNYAEQISKEAAAEQYPALRGFLGLD